MKFDTVIIGGGLSGLVCGIRLQKKGVKCAIISAGQSALHFSSGSFELLNRLPDGTAVENPVEAVAKLEASHPYKKIGDFAKYASEAKQLLADSGVEVEGEATENALHLTPMGTLKPAWLTLSEFNRFKGAEEFKGKKVRVANIAGFLDFNMKFVTDALEDMGAKCCQELIHIEEVDRLRKSPTEMRATNIARVLDKENIHNQLLTILKNYSIGVDAVVLPAAVGLASQKLVKALRKAVPSVILVPTMPPSVSGIRTQQQLRREFERLGGVFMLGDSVVRADVEGGKVKAVYTINHADNGIKADNYILTTGSFFSNGLVAHSNEIVEPVFGLDVDFAADRAEWCDPQFFNKQGYQTFGVATDANFNVKKEGKVLENLYAAGSVLSGFNALYEGCGAGVALLTALYVADNLK